MSYPQLRRLASARMKDERAGHSWQATLLVNELYLEIIKIKALKPPETDGGSGGILLEVAVPFRRWQNLRSFIQSPDLRPGLVRVQHLTGGLVK